jgi:uncharacterized membrane protein YkvA (DUF1232 family)
MEVMTEARNASLPAVVPTVEETERNERVVDEGFWPKLRAQLHRLPFADELLAAYFAATDRRTPWRVKATLFGALAYFVMPADMIPDFLLALGFTDDAAVLMAAIHAVRSSILPEHRERAKAAIEEERARQAV